MPPSTRGSASAELAPVDWSPLPVYLGRPTLAAVLARPSGVAGLALTGVTIAVALIGPLLVATDPHALSGPVLRPPSLEHPMGTDALGRDLLSGVLHGARTSLLVASAVGLLSFVCGMVVGMSAGYAGGLVDDVLMRATELFQVLPRFFLVIVAVALFGPGIDRIVLTLGLTSWPVVARVVRGEVVATRELDFVLAARASGASASRILWRELLPHVLPSAVVLLGLLFGQVLLVEASLGFLGLGDPNALSWGLLAGQASGFLRVAWWLAFFPGLAITVAVLGLNLLADAASAALGRR
jgi:peptide/nickel transport system permease protein